MTSDKANRRFCPECFQTFPLDAKHCPEHGVELADLPSVVSLVGETLDQKYEIVKKIGRGGMGTVYHARQKLIGREIAIKVLRPEFAQDVHAIQRFFTEVRAACQLRSRHCVIAHDFGLSTEGHLYYTMELLHGRPLTLLLKEGPLEADRAMLIAIDICRAIEEAHGKGIVHRDLKPDNVMLVRDKQGSHAKVLDFGIAKLLTEADGVSLTQTGMVCGTPEYMSPEQARGDDLGFASDIYSLGIILYEMLAGLPPFQAPSPLRVLLKHINDTPRPLRVVSPDVEVPSDLDRYLLRMLAKDPANRPESATDVRLALEQILNTQGERSTTSLPKLVSSSDGVRRVTVPLGGKADLESRVTDAIPITRPETGKTMHEEPDAALTERKTTSRPSENSPEMEMDQEPGADTIAVVGIISGRRRRMLWIVGGILGLGLIVITGILSGIIDPNGSSDDDASVTRSAAVTEPDARIAPMSTLDARSADVSGTTHKGEQEIAESREADVPNAEFPMVEDTMREMQEVAGNHPAETSGDPLLPEHIAPALDTLGADRAAAVARDDGANLPEDPGPKTAPGPGELHPESAAAAHRLETGLRYKIERKYDLAIEAFREAKASGGDLQELDNLIEECERLREGAR